VFMDSTSKTTTIDFREKAPLLATPDMFLDEQDKLIEGSNHNGLKSVGVPGTVAGLYMAHGKYGSLPWKKLVQPAIDLARKGIVLSYTLSSHAKDIRSGPSPDFMKNYFNDSGGMLLEHGDLWKQKELANTLKEIKRHGRDGFYKGKVAQEIAAYMKNNGGLIGHEDLEKYTAIEREPVKGTYHGYDIYSMPPPSSGGVALIEMMNLIELANLDSVAFNSTEYVHLVAETMRRAFADRAEHLGDPDFNPDLPLDKLISKDFAKMRYDNIDFYNASVSDSTRFGQLNDGTNTTHLSVMDKDHNAVSLTYTLEHSYGSEMGSQKLGFIFNNEMGDFNPQPGYTNSSGLIGSDPNLIRPEKRMLSSMTPTIVAKVGTPYLVIGSPGGRTIINTVFQTVLNVLGYEMPIEKAIETMKIHHQWLPDQLEFEKYLLSPDTQKSLEKMGHKTRGVENLGRLMGIIYDPELNIYIGASDSSSPDGAPIGY
ncbi:gamma-glutamyltransferase, partial [Pricia sp.]|uniref:gamma-glutamyltransferase n=1 Tax=Pricia sp. TaxID=2268138 RepID=UPI003593433D